MTVTRNFTLRGDFIDRITAPLERINNTLEEQLRIQRDLISVNERVSRSQRQASQATGNQAENLRSAADGWREFREQMTQAEIAAKGIEKISEGFVNGISNAFEKMTSAAMNSMNFVKERFGEAMADQIDDIQAAGSVFGSLTSAGLIEEGAGGYKKAKGIYKQLDMAIGEAVKSSTAPTDTIIGFSRTLTDNILPELIKTDLKKNKGTYKSQEEGMKKATEKASSFMAEMYEQMALLTPAGYSPGMVSKSVGKMLQGESLKSLSKYDFFQMNPVLMNELEKLGFESANSVKQRLDIFKKALSTSLSPEAIAEMRNSISGGMQALEDTFLNPTVGIFSFARGFDWNTDGGVSQDFGIKNKLMENTLKATRAKGASRLDLKGRTLDDYVNSLDTPIKIIGSSVGPFLQELASFFGTAGPVMGDVANLFDELLGPILRKLAFNARVLQQDVASGKVSLSFALGRMFAEIIKGITQLFKPGGASEQLGGMIENFLDEVVKGFKSLEHDYDWDGVIDGIMETVKNTILLPGIREVLGLIFVSLAAPAVISGIFSAITLSLTTVIASWASSVAGPAIFGYLTSIATAFGGVIAAVFSPIGVIIMILSAVVVLLVSSMIRYRDEIGEILKHNWETVKRYFEIGNLKAKKDWDETLLGLAKALQNFIQWVRDVIPGQKDFGKGIDEFVDDTQERIAETDQKIDYNSDMFEIANARLAKAQDELGKAVQKDVGAMGDTIGNAMSNIGKTVGPAIGGMTKSIGKGVNYIDNLGGGIDATTKKTEVISKAGETTTQAAQDGAVAVKEGTTKVIQSIGKVERAAKSISAAGGAGGGGIDVGIDAIAKGTAASQRFNGVANRCAAIVKAYLEANGKDASGMTLMAESAKNMGTVMTDWSKLKSGDLIGWSGGPGHGDEHVGVYTGGSNVFHQSAARGLKAGNYPDLDYFKKQRGAYFVRMNFDGFIPDMFKGLLSAANMESKMMPSSANVVVANDSEAILTQQQAMAVDNVLYDYQSRSTSNSKKVINIIIKTISPDSITEERAKQIGQQITGGFQSRISSELQSVALSNY